MNDIPVVKITAEVETTFDKSDAQKTGEKMGEAILEGTTKITSKRGVIPKLNDSVIRKLKDSLKGLGDTIQAQLKPIKVLTNRIGRIALYRGIRTMLKTISQALKDGVNNLYQWSKLQNDVFGKTFASSMDKMATSWLYLKNSVATIVAPLLEGIANLVEKVADAVASAIEKLSQFMGYLTNSGYYLRATKANIAYAKSVNAVKNALMGFDELNVLSGSSSGDSADYSSYFEKVALGTEGFGMNLAFSVKDILFDWKDLSAESIAQKIVTGLNALTGALIGWKIGGLGGALLGAVVGASIGAIISSLVFDNDGKLSADELGALIWAGLVGFVGGVLGFNFAHTVNGTMMGFTIGASLGMILYKTAFSSGRNKMGNDELAGLLKVGLLPIIGGVLGMIFLGATLSPLGGAALGIGIGVALTMIIQGITWDTKGVSYEVPDSLISEVQKESSIAGNYDAISDALKNVNTQLEKQTTNIANQLKTSNVTNSERKKIVDAVSQVGIFANGGTPDVGTLFWAGENGAELVTQVGGRSTVYNEEQLGSSLAYANEGVISAINTLIGVVRSKSNNVTISASDIRKAVNSSSMRVGV